MKLTAMLLGLGLLSAAAQGTINFINFNAGAGLNAPVYLSDGATRVSGPNYAAQLMAGPSPGSMMLVGSPTPFLTGGGAGYFSGGIVSVPTVPGGGTAYVTVVAWDTTLGGTTTGATPDEAFAYKQSGHGNIWAESGVDRYGVVHPFTAITGDPLGNPPTAPGLLVGLQSFCFDPIPEPTVTALVLLGGCMLMLFRNRNKGHQTVYSDSFEPVGNAT